MDNLASIFAQNLVKLRSARHITQLELAHELNYSDKAVSRWERAQAIPDAKVLLQLAELFGVTVDYLLHEHPELEYTEPLPEKKINYKAIIIISLLGVYRCPALLYHTAPYGHNPLDDISLRSPGRAYNLACDELRMVRRKKKHTYHLRAYMEHTFGALPFFSRVCRLKSVAAAAAWHSCPDNYPAVLQNKASESAGFAS